MSADHDPSNPSVSPDHETVVARVTRRGFLGIGLAGVATAMMPRLLRAEDAAVSASGGWQPVSWSQADQIEIPGGFSEQVVVRWGDPLTSGAPAFSPQTQTGAAQARQFGYNCDFVGYLPLPHGSTNSDHGLLCVSSEYTNPELMWPAGISASDFTREQCAVDMAAHGLNVVEVVRRDGTWQYVPDSRYNRRVTGASPIQISGPAAGHAKMRTSADASGTMVLGTVNNCAGGLTPWGTWLQAEENVHGYFRGDADAADPYVADTMRRLGVKDSSRRKWERHHPRFDLDQEPHEAHRFGWIVELDPYHPDSVPVKRTALGRFKHEAATTVVADDGRLVIYMGDDERFEYVYKFVTHDRYRPGDRAHNSSLLDHGTLYVARYDDNGSGEWMPLIHGYGPLTAANGFADQGDVLIRTRQAADALGATPMDRPEDVEASPVTGHVYIACTNNSKRAADDLNGPNPRGPNRHGHVIEMRESGDDATATDFAWEVFLSCGPHDADGADYQGHADAAPISCPDNLAFDRHGNLWISTDGQPKSGANDAVYLVPTSGPERGRSRQFLSAVPGAEVCGPCFTPDHTTFFCAIQHPGDTDDATFANPGTRWPDRQADMPPRPSVIAIVNESGTAII